MKLIELTKGKKRKAIVALRVAILISLIMFVELRSFAAGQSTLHIGNDTTICFNKCLTLTSNINGSYHWSTGASTSTITVCPSGNTQITLKVSNSTGDYYDTINVAVDKYCVWPGDADNNGKVSKKDVLELGIAFNATGSGRSNSSNNWQAQHAADWSKSFKNGKNYKYADCNGDGVVDINDLEVITSNWSKSHKKTEDTIYSTTNSQLFFIPNKDTVHAGDTLNLAIYLGTVTNQANAIYGVSFTYNFPPNSLQSGSMSLNVNSSNCWLNSSGGNVISFLNADYVMESADIVITRTNGIAITGYGQIGVLSVIVIDNVGNKKAVDGPLRFYISDIEAISNDESNIPLSPISGTVYYKSSLSAVKTTVKTKSKVDIYPNPMVSNKININVHDINALKTEILNITGKVVFSSDKTYNQTSEFEIPALKQGLYVVRISTNEGTFIQKLSINKH